MKAEYIDHMGSDLTVANAARVSFDKESTWDYYGTDPYGNPFQLTKEQQAEHDLHRCEKRLSEKDTKLIGYLSRNGHWTPFAHPQISIRETVPIFVARQRFKHMIGFTYNEVSRRYVDDTPEFFVPEVWRSRPDGSVKQGSGEGAIHTLVDDDIEQGINTMYEDLIDHAQRLYAVMLDNNVAPEQARMVLPQSMYTSYWVTGSLAAWARAYKQRIDSHAQKEIQDLAKQWGEIIEPLYPVAWKALTEE